MTGKYPRYVYVGVKDGRVVTLIADIGAEIADDVADAIRAGGTIHRFPMAHSPRLGDEVPHD